MFIILFQPVTFYVSSLCSWPSSVSTKCPTTRTVITSGIFHFVLSNRKPLLLCGKASSVNNRFVLQNRNPTVLPKPRGSLFTCALEVLHTNQQRQRERSFLKIFRLGEIKDVLLFFRGCLAAAAAAVPVFSHLLTLSCAAVQSAGCDQQTTVCRARTVLLKKNLNKPCAPYGMLGRKKITP